jgi:Polysaccharide lyase
MPIVAHILGTRTSTLPAPLPRMKSETVFVTAVLSKKVVRTASTDTSIAAVADTTASAWRSPLRASTATKNYILAPLEREHWYDLVLHTRWTPEKGGPGNSVSAVWLDGKQMLGNETIPVSMPTEFWHGSPAIHNTDAYLQFGLYRGPSAEDPASRLFLDSYRTGNSYSQVAPESRLLTPHVEAETFGAMLKGAGLPELVTSLGTFKCVGTSLEGVAANPTAQLAFQPKYGECEITSGGTKYVASVKTNGCRYVLGVKNAGPPYVGTWGVACEKEGEAIEFKLTKSASNCLKLYPQAGLDGLSLSNTGEGAARVIEMAAEVKAIKYEWLGVCGKETRSDGVFKGLTTLTASDSGGKGIGAYLTGAP